MLIVRQEEIEVLYTSEIMKYIKEYLLLISISAILKARTLDGA